MKSPSFPSRRFPFSRALFVLCALFALGGPAHADTHGTKTTRLAGIFGDNMVLQREARVNVWGWDRPGAQIQITTSWGGTAAATADASGSWKAVQIAPWNYGDPDAVGSALLREAQLRALDDIPNAGMVVNLDYGNCRSIHPFI